MEKSERYYIYAHVRQDNGEIVYIGKGTGNRLLKNNRNPYWRAITTKYPIARIKLLENLSEKDAYNRERIFIEFYKQVGLCRANISLGGKGVIVSERWWGDAISKAMKGKSTGAGENSRSWKPYVSERELRYWYVEKEATLTEIGERFGLSYATVSARLRRVGIPARDAGRTKKRVVCVEDGREYGSISDAARAYGAYRENVRKVLAGDYKKTANRTFAYVS